MAVKTEREREREDYAKTTRLCHLYVTVWKVMKFKGRNFAGLKNHGK